MGKTTHYGKPKTYPFFFRAERGKGDTFISGTFKTKKACRAASKTYPSAKSNSNYRIRIIDRRK